MPGSNFDPAFQIDSNGRIAPKGPLDLQNTDKNIQVYAWVSQYDTWSSGVVSAACSGEVNYSNWPSGNQWTINSPKTYGSFVRGKARGTGLVMYERAGKYPLVYWWNETVDLT